MGVEARIRRRQSTCHPQEDLLGGADGLRLPPELPSNLPHHTVGDSCTSCASSSLPAPPLLKPRQPPAPPPPRPEKHHVYVWCFRSYLLFMRLLLLLLLLQGDDDITRHPADIPNIHTHTHRGPSGFVRGQRWALWTRTTGHATSLLFSPHWSIGIALCLRSPARCRISWHVNKPECFFFSFFFLLLLKFPFQTEDLDFYLMSLCRDLSVSARSEQFEVL